MTPQAKTFEIKGILKNSTRSKIKDEPETRVTFDIEFEQRFTNELIKEGLSIKEKCSSQEQ